MRRTASNKDNKMSKQQRREEKSKKRKSKFMEKLDMYDMIIANIIAGNSIIEPKVKLDNSQLAIGFSDVSSQTHYSKYFMIGKLPDYIRPNILELVKENCKRKGVKVNIFTYAEPHKINWDSADMKNRMGIWERYSNSGSGVTSVFSYRQNRNSDLTKRRIIASTKYLNEADLEYRRNLLKVCIVIEISALRTEECMTNMAESIEELKSLMRKEDIKINELRISMIDWLKALNPFSLHVEKEIGDKLAKKVVTDDILANLKGYKQGKVGREGIPLGLDIYNGDAVFHKFREDEDAAENWLVAAGTGSGKSLLIKDWIPFFLATNFVVSVMDYEGDEYNNLANYIRAGNPDDVKIVSMGKGSTVYFDPCEIPELTGDSRIDDELKESAMDFIMAIFRLLVKELEGDLSKEQERVISMGIQRMYDTAGVTEEKETWKYSKGLRLSNVYNEIKMIMENKELVDIDSDNLKHKAAISIVDAASIYFEEGEAKYGTFKNPMSVNELYRAKLIIYSFGMKGADSSTMDPTLLALKQLSVSYVQIQISNHCKYVRHCFNVKIWEEFQRYGEAKGSADVISNVITGGRKRGDINFILTNDLAKYLDKNNLLTNKLRQNIQNYAIGAIKDSDTREDFCNKFNQKDILGTLNKIAKANRSKKGKMKMQGEKSIYKNTFCIVLENGTKAVIKARLPKALMESKLFTSGINK